MWCVLRGMYHTHPSIHPCMSRIGLGAGFGTRGSLPTQGMQEYLRRPHKTDETRLILCLNVCEATGASSVVSACDRILELILCRSSRSPVPAISKQWRPADVVEDKNNGKLQMTLRILGVFFCLGEVRELFLILSAPLVQIVRSGFFLGTRRS